MRSSRFALWLNRLRLFRQTHTPPTMSPDPMHTKSIPILVDNSLNRAIAIKYAIFSVFGLVGIFTRIPSVSTVSGDLVALIVACIVFGSAAVAACAAWNTERGPTWQKLEIYSAITFVSFATIYAITLGWLALSGSDGRIGVTLLAVALLVMPIWRIRYLIRRGRSQ